MATKTQTNPSQIANGATGFSTALLQKIGAPVTKGNIAILNLWQRFEGGPPDNPLNTSIYTGSPTGHYGSVSAAVDATAATLKAGFYNSGNSNIVGLLKSGKAAPIQIAQAITNSPWDAGHYAANRAANGTYVGGHLVSALLGSSASNGGILGDIATAGGEVAHYAANPISGLQTTGNAAVGVVEKPVLDAAHYILYGLAILGGGALILVGMILIGADIGLERARDARPAKLAGRALGAPGERRERREREQADAEYAEHERTVRVYKRQEAKAKATSARSRARVQVSRERSKRRPIGGGIPF